MWINVEGYKGKYQISNNGEVRSIHPSRGVRILSPCRASNGKLYIELYWKGRRKTYMLHNLLADSFKIPVEDAKRIIYEGYKGKNAAKDNVRAWLIEKIAECERSHIDYHDEILYLKKFLSSL